MCHNNNVQLELMVIIYQLIVKYHVLIQICMEIIKPDSVKILVQQDGSNKGILKSVLKHVQVKI